jgi:ABC-2 type transport system ATP-binding protein
MVAGHDVVTEPLGVRRSISLTGQYAAVDEKLTGRENLEMMARLLGAPRRHAKNRAGELLDLFGLSDPADERVGRYSGGMKRRLDLAASLVTKPKLLFLDEPTTGLDPRSREQLWAEVRAQVDGAVSVLLTTQYLGEADELAGRVVMLDRGRVVAQGRTDELKARTGTSVLWLQFADPASFAWAAGQLHVLRRNESLLTAEVPTDGSAAQVRSVLDVLEANGCQAARVAVLEPSLDDVFFSLTGSGVDEAGTRRVA